ncbi:hypothetical protein ACLIA0_13625 [Bacillaceae bacterium W0354]
MSSESTELETSVSGTVFISGEGETPEQVRIITQVETDPKDWGGVGIHLPDEWDVSSITSSYPKDGEGPEDFIALWTTAADDTKHGWDKLIEIGRDIQRYTSSGGGKGTVIIILDINEDKKDETDSFRMAVGVGSRDKDGIRTLYPDSKHIEIQIPE